MDKLIWNDRLNIGVEIIDEAHAYLFRIAGKLIELIENEANYRNACREGLRYLEDYCMQHFSEEEAYMRSIRYRGYEKHKQLHDIFRDQTLVSLKKNLEASDYSQAAAHRFLGVLLGWLTGHIMVEDQEIAGEIHTAGNHDTSSETAIAAGAVSQAMQDMFRLEAKLADGNYQGRNMGMEFFCRLCYDADDGGKVQLLLGMEERLLRRGVGLLFGLYAMQNTALVHEVSLQIFEQFLHYMGKLFEPDTAYRLSRAELLTDDEFRSDFMTRYSVCARFETRLGDFVFCSRRWLVRHKKASAPEGQEQQKKAM